MKKILLVSSSGGHFEQLKILKKLSENADFDILVVTEKTKYTKKSEADFFVGQMNRKEIFFIFKFLRNYIRSLVFILREKPDVIISTGALSALPFFLNGKIFKKNLIFIESFAKVTSPTLTGKIIYKIADTFIVQWEELKQFYPEALYLGSIY